MSTSSRPGVERRLAAILAADVVGFSRLMSQDEEGTLTRVKNLRRDVVEPKTAEHRGRIFKTMGDGFLVEFSSPVEAIRCAVAIQEAIGPEAPQTTSEALQLRIGINIGDIILEEDGDIFGDGVNVAARLQTMADPGGIRISGKVYDEVRDKVPYAFEDLGDRQVKNIPRPVRVYAVPTGRAVGIEQRTGAELRQFIAFCRAPDGVQLAFARVGSGPPLVKAANYMNHLEYDWESPVWGHVLERLAADHTLIRYDARGNGLSDWDVEELSLEAWVTDLETVVEAAGLDRFPLLGVSQGCAVSIAYAVRHPEKVSRLVLYGGFALGGRRRSAEERQKRDAMTTLIRLGWGADEPTFRQLFTSQFLPGGTKEQIDAFNELQRRTTTAECAARYFEIVGNIDVRELLPNVKAPTLVMHVRGDRICPIEAGRQMAAAIPGARFVALEGQNHMFLEGEPATERFFEETTSFLSS
jgi:class 3 adenylate cyclase/pimeloyl-ACP methyl ester carboxylesterase